MFLRLWLRTVYIWLCILFKSSTEVIYTKWNTKREKHIIIQTLYKVCCYKCKDEVSTKSHMYTTIFLYLMLIRQIKRFSKNTHQKFRKNCIWWKRNMIVWGINLKTYSPTWGPKLDRVIRRIQVVVLQLLYDILGTLYTCQNRFWNNKNGTWTWQLSRLSDPIIKITSQAPSLFIKYISWVINPKTWLCMIWYTCREHGVCMEATPNWFLSQSKPYTALSPGAKTHLEHD